jgi:probable phosphomutase (TIGR03848 family)
VTTLFLVRHAVTSHTGHKLTGWTEGVGLTAEGRSQADATAAKLANVEFEAIYASPIDRTLETARAIAKPHKMRVRSTKGLGEVHYGGWTNRSLKTLMKTKLWDTVQRFPSQARFPDGESIREVQARAVTEIERICEEHPDGKVCCVSHGDVIKLIAAHYLGVHIDLYQRIVIGPASISVISITKHGPHILALNEMPS